MKPFQEKEMLDSFKVLVDTREQNNERLRRRLARLEVPFSRVPLNYGDYTYNALLPSGKWLFDEDKMVSGLAVIERKMSIDEIAGNFTRSRERFQKEFNRAAEHDARIYVLVENGSWEKILGHKYNSKMHPNSLKASINAWMVRYNTNITFCKEETTPILIRDILYRDLKERIEKGEFDEL